MCGEFLTPFLPALFNLRPDGSKFARWGNREDCTYKSFLREFLNVIFCQGLIEDGILLADGTVVPTGENQVRII